MRIGDYITVLLVAFLMAIAAGKEIQDVFHCQALRLSPIGQNQPQFHITLKILELARRFVLLPMVVSVVPILVMHRGADALSLCFNALAILFLLDCDNHVFHALSTTARRKAGRLILSQSAEQLLNYSKTIHIILITAAIPLSIVEIFVIPIASPEHSIFLWMVQLWPILLVFPVGGCAEVFAEKEKDQNEKLRACLVVLGKWLLGLLIMIFTAVPIFYGNIYGHRGYLVDRQHTSDAGAWTYGA